MAGRIFWGTAREMVWIGCVAEGEGDEWTEMLRYAHEGMQVRR